MTLGNLEFPGRIPLTLYSQSGGGRTHLFGPPSRIESDGESQLWGDTLNWGANPRAPGGRRFWRLVLILSIAGRPSPQRGRRLGGLLLPCLYP